jgi:hypothetical protein
MLKKAEKLRLDNTRGGITFDDCENALSEGKLLNDIPNPSPAYREQRIFIIEINNYAYIVPYVRSKNTIFLKTVYPSRKYTKIYLR